MDIYTQMSILSRTRATRIVRRNSRNGMPDPKRLIRYIDRLSNYDRDSEWYISSYTPSTIDHPYCTCGREYTHQYYLTNIDTGKSLLAGSSCIRRMKDHTLTSQMGESKMEYDMRNSTVYARLRYEGDISTDIRRHIFKVRYNTTLYKVIERLNSNNYIYKSWYRDKEDEYYLIIPCRYARTYDVGTWYMIPLSIYETATTAGNYISFKYI